MKILVCGGRNNRNYGHMRKCLEDIAPDFIVTGGATGTDAFAERWAAENGIPYRIYPAEWEKYGRKAGILRNIQMLDSEDVDAVVVFAGGKGTRHMKGLALERGVKVIDCG